MGVGAGSGTPAYEGGPPRPGEAGQDAGDSAGDSGAPGAAGAEASRAGGAAGAVAPYAFPDTFAVVAAAEDVLDMADPAFRLLVLTLMRRALAPRHDFFAAYSAHPRDHLVEIVERCRSHRDPAAALGAFRDAVAALRPYDRATAELGRLIGEPG